MLMTGVRKLEKKRGKRRRKGEKNGTFTLVGQLRSCNDRINASFTRKRELKAEKTEKKEN